jgi:DNA-binding GntR family transcriptional regulator
MIGAAMSPIDGTTLQVGGAQERTLADRAFSAIHDAIVGGTVEPGERLRIEELGQALGMSPMPVREALRRLDAVGLVEQIPHRGARVTVLSIEDLREIYDARLALEGLALRRAAERISSEKLEEARAALELMADDRRRRAQNLWVAHQRFHFALYEGAGSRWLLRLITPLWESSERYRVNIVRKARFDIRQAEHEEIFAAVEAGESDRAADLVHDHLVQTANDIASRMDHSEPLFALRGGSSGKARARSQRSSRSPRTRTGSR